MQPEGLLESLELDDGDGDGRIASADPSTRLEVVPIAPGELDVLGPRLRLLLQVTEERGAVLRSRFLTTFPFGAPAERGGFTVSRVQKEAGTERELISYFHSAIEIYSAVEVAPQIRRRVHHMARSFRIVTEYQGRGGDNAGGAGTVIPLKGSRCGNLTETAFFIGQKYC